MSLFAKLGVTSIAIIDFETTGLSPTEDFPTEVAIKKVGFGKGMLYEQEYSSLIKLPAGETVPEFITELTGLTLDKLNWEGKPLAHVIPEVQNLIDSETLVIAHNANFDLGFLFHHMGIEPRSFMCTRAIAILTEPDKNASLNKLYARMFGDKTQTHRAMGDVQMTFEVFDAFIQEIGAEELMFFLNKVVVMPDRELVFTPHNAQVLDFTEGYVSAKAHEKLQRELEKVINELQEVANERDAYEIEYGGMPL